MNRCHCYVKFRSTLTQICSHIYTATCFSPKEAILREYWYISWAGSTIYVSRCKYQSVVCYVAVVSTCYVEFVRIFYVSIYRAVSLTSAILYLSNICLLSLSIFVTLCFNSKFSPKLFTSFLTLLLFSWFSPFLLPFLLYIWQLFEWLFRALGRRMYLVSCLKMSKVIKA